MEVSSRKRRAAHIEAISPREFLQAWNVEALDAVHIKPQLKESEILNNVAASMGVSDETIKELADVCGKQNLVCDSEPVSKRGMMELKTAPPEATTELESLRLYLEHREQRTQNASLRSAVSRQMKYNIMDEYLAVVPAGSKSSVDDEEFQVQVPNVILNVQITKCLYQGQKISKNPETETFAILATQYLTDLRDKIKCSSDAVIGGDYSAMPDMDPNSLQRAGELYKSSFFFIENVFYNDLRNSDNKDYSKPIISWAKQRGQVEDYKTARMEETLLNDLKIRLGHHYLFTHQGNCEHSVQFTDMRLFTSQDVQDVRQYPLLCVARMRNRTVCQGCTKLSAKWLVQDSPLIPTDPCFLCKLCFKTLLYDKKGCKVSNFKAFHFSDFHTA